MRKVSFVVQGPIYEKTDIDKGRFSTFDVLASIRKFYPDEEIILSTWKGAKVEGLSYDRLILNEDPGSIFFRDGSATNCNRLIVSAKAGLVEASSEYVVKTRTDILFTANNLLEKLNLVTPNKSKHALFQSFVLSTVYYVRDPILFNCHFHASDIFLFGRKKDLLSYFDVPLAEANVIGNKNQDEVMVTEQYLFTNNILKKKNTWYKMPIVHFTSLNHFLASEKYIFNNYLFFNPEELGLQFPLLLYNAYKPECNYTLGNARFLSAAYRSKNLRVIVTRGAKYYYKYILPFRVKLAIKKIFGERLLNRLKE